MTGITAGQIKQFREEDGYSREEFAEMYRISLETLDGWENGTITPDDETVESLMMLFDI